MVYQQHGSDLARVCALVGTPYTRMDCWQLVQHAFGLRGVTLAGDYVRCAYGPTRSFDTVHSGDFAEMMTSTYRPRAWDVVVIRNHEFLPTHVGIVIDDQFRFIQSVEDAGVCIQRLDRVPYIKPRRICGFVRLREFPA